MGAAWTLRYSYQYLSFVKMDASKIKGYDSLCRITSSSTIITIINKTNKNNNLTTKPVSSL